MEHSVLIDYRGSIKYETIGELIHDLKHQVPRMAIPTGIYKRILLVMIESLENIMKHSQVPDGMNDDMLPTLTIIHHADYYTLRCSNLLRTSDIQKLREKLNYINSLNAQSLKDFYKSTITNGVFTKTGGAGLGLIEIAKISGNPIHYEFSSVDNNYTRFFQQIKIEPK